MTNGPDLVVGLVKSAMSAQEKQYDLSFSSSSSTPSPDPTYYPNWIDVGTAIATYLKGEIKIAPTAAQTAKAIVDAVEKDKSPGKMWLGQHAFEFRYIFPYLPVWLADVFWGKIMKMDMAQKRGN
jgi:hypothetical protein